MKFVICWKSIIAPFCAGKKHPPNRMSLKKNSRKSASAIFSISEEMDMLYRKIIKLKIGNELE
ncbi:MAG: hypothetical protein ABFC90_05060 [Bacteroidales bacterium]|nr:hypothetical protein [Bacteroidales bacterium]